jgi:hypothetical protein
MENLERFNHEEVEFVSKTDEEKIRESRELKTEGQLEFLKRSIEDKENMINEKSGKGMNTIALEKELERLKEQKEEVERALKIGHA